MLYFTGSAAEKSIAALQTAWNQERIGRDKLPRFSNWHSREAAAVRYIRMACEVLGPTGDEKSGCRDLWLAYCSMMELKSTIPSYKDNRFNSVFVAAVSILQHRMDIISFLQDYMPTRNQKLESVLQDAISEEVNIFVGALAMLFYRVTGPYWQLLCVGKRKYAEFFMPVVELHTQLKEWADDSSSTFMETVPSLFGAPLNNRFHTLLHFDEDSRPKVQQAISAICQAFVEVTERQLCDFLPDGRYHAVQDPAVLAKMEYSHITNLLGEACFGDLDVSIYTRRNTSVHHHSTLIMLKRNKTMTEWFLKKSAEEQCRLLQMSSSKASRLRKRHQEQHQDVAAAKRQRLEVQHQKKEQSEENLARTKASILTEVDKLGGALTAVTDVERLLTRCRLQREKVSAMKAHVRFFKMVLGFKSEHLKLTQDLPNLVQSLKAFLQEENPFPRFLNASHLHAADTLLDKDACDSESEEMEVEEEQNCAASLSNLHSESDAENEIPTSPASPSIQDTVPTEFRFRKAGQNVAIFYDQDFHVGQVAKIISEHEAEIQFMRKSSLTNNTYTWPSKADTDTVACIFVFDFDFPVTTTNGRIWHIPSSDRLA